MAGESDDDALLRSVDAATGRSIEDMSRAELLLEKAKMKRLRAGLAAKRAGLEAEAAALENAIRIMGKTGDQGAVLRAWFAISARSSIETSFAEDDSTEDYVIDLADFKRWTLHLEPAAPFTPHAEDRAYNYSCFEPVEIAPGLAVCGASWKEGSRHPALLVHAILRGQWPAIFHMDDALMVSTDAPEDVALSDGVRRALSQLSLLMARMCDYIAAATFETIERKPKQSVMEKAGFKRRPKPGPVLYRLIRAVRRIYVGAAATSINWSAPSHRVAVGGFWRKCAGVGKDRDGNPVLGRTWVRAHTRWNDKPEAEQRIVYVKEPLRLEGPEEGR